MQDESDLDDEAMFRLDAKLAAAFRSLRKGSKLDKDKAMQLRHYKMRHIIYLLTGVVSSLADYLHTFCCLVLMML